MEEASDVRWRPGGISAGSVTPDARGRFAEQAEQVTDCDGVSVCVDCGLPFAPRAKASATRCELCHRSRTAPPLFQRVAHADGRGWSQSGVDGVYHFRECAACGETILARTAVTVYCPDDPACRKVGGRGRTRQNPGAVCWTPEYRQAIAAAVEAQVAAKLAQVAATRHLRPPLSLEDTETLLAEVRARRSRRASTATSTRRPSVEDAAQGRSRAA